MTDQLISVLRKLSLKRKEEALRLGRDEPLPIIFHTDGKPTSQNTIRNIYLNLFIQQKIKIKGQGSALPWLEKSSKRTGEESVLLRLGIKERHSW